MPRKSSESQLMSFKGKRFSNISLTPSKVNKFSKNKPGTYFKSFMNQLQNDHHLAHFRKIYSQILFAVPYVNMIDSKKVFNAHLEKQQLIHNDKKKQHVNNDNEIIDISSSEMSDSEANSLHGEVKSSKSAPRKKFKSGYISQNKKSLETSSKVSKNKGKKRNLSNSSFNESNKTRQSRLSLRTKTKNMKQTPLPTPSKQRKTLNSFLESSISNESNKSSTSNKSTDEFDTVGIKWSRRRKISIFDLSKSSEEGLKNSDTKRLKNKQTLGKIVSGAENDTSGESERTKAKSNSMVSSGKSVELEHSDEGESRARISSPATDRRLSSSSVSSKGSHEGSDLNEQSNLNKSSLEPKEAQDTLKSRSLSPVVFGHIAENLRKANSLESVQSSSPKTPTTKKTLEVSELTETTENSISRDLRKARSLSPSPAKSPKISCSKKGEFSKLNKQSDGGRSSKYLAKRPSTPYRLSPVASSEKSSDKEREDVIAADSDEDDNVVAIAKENANVEKAAKRDTEVTDTTTLIVSSDEEEEIASVNFMAANMRQSPSIIGNVRHIDATKRKSAEFKRTKVANDLRTGILKTPKNNEVSTSLRKSSRSSCQMIESSALSGKSKKRLSLPSMASTSDKPAVVDSQKDFFDKLELTKNPSSDKSESEKENETPPGKKEKISTKSDKVDKNKKGAAKHGLPFKIRLSKSFVYSPYTCDSCAEVFKTNTELQFHCFQHLDARTPRVNVCRSKFAENSTFNGKRPDDCETGEYKSGDVNESAVVSKTSNIDKIKKVDYKTALKVAGKYTKDLSAFDSFSESTQEKETEEIGSESSSHFVEDPADRFLDDKVDTEGKAEEDKAAEDKTAEDKTAEDKTAEDKTVEDKTVEDKTVEDKAVEDITEEDKPDKEDKADKPDDEGTLESDGENQKSCAENHSNEESPKSVSSSIYESPQEYPSDSQKTVV